MGRNKTTFGATREDCHIANLNEDQLLTGRIKHRFPEGKITTLGKMSSNDNDSDDDDDNDDDEENSDSDESEGEEEELPDIVLGGEGIFPKQATVENVEGKCYIHAKNEGANNTYVNGVSVAVLLKTREQKVVEVQKAERRKSRASLLSLGDSADIANAVRASLADAASVVPKPEDAREGILLEHGDRVVFGQSLFVFVDPFQGMAEVLIMSGEVSYAKARKELSKNSWKSAGLKFMKGMKLSGTSNNLITKMCKRMSLSDADAKGDGDGELGNEDKSDDSNSDDEEELDREELEEELEQTREYVQDCMKQLESRDRGIEELKRQLAAKDMQLAAARADGGLAVRKSNEILGKSKEVRGEIMHTFESAIDAIEEVESQIAARMAARSRTLP